MGSAKRKAPLRGKSPTRTLGDLLYADERKSRVSENDWAGLVHSIATGNQDALYALYEQAHRLVFTLVVRITNNVETAEELTVDVFHDVWRRAAAYDPAGGSVVGWIMNQARSRAIDRMRFEQRKKRVGSVADDPSTANASRLTYPEVAARLDQPLGTVKTRIRSGLGKLRQALAEIVKGR